MGEGVFESKYLNDSICLNKTTTDTALLVLLPPVWVFMDQKKKDKSRFKKFLVVVLSVILTGLFYIPGLIHALYYMNQNREDTDV